MPCLPEPLLRHLISFRTGVDSHGMTAQRRCHREGSSASHIRIENPIPGKRAGSDEPFEQSLRLLRGITGSLFGDRGKNGNIPNVPQRDTRRLLRFGGRASPTTSIIEYGFLFAGSPSFQGRRRQRLVLLNESRRLPRVPHPPQKYVMHSLEIRGPRRPAAIAPNDFAGEAFGTKNFVADNF